MSLDHYIGQRTLFLNKVTGSYYSTILVGLSSVLGHVPVFCFFPGLLTSEDCKSVPETETSACWFDGGLAL